MIPAFIRVIPAEVLRYGPDAAIVLAHIRYRDQSDGPGRIIDGDGACWWRVSQTDMGREVGLSRREIQTALRALGGVLAVMHFPPLTDQSRAYRLLTDQNGADLPESQTVQWADLPESEMGQPPAPNGPPPCTKRATALLTGELEKGEKRGRERASEPPGPVAVPDFANAPPNQTDNKPPPCQKHPHGYDHDEPCRPCATLRKWAENADQRRKEHYRAAWTEYNELRDHALAGAFGDWRPTRPPLYPSDFDPDTPWHQPTRPEEQQ